MGLLKMTATFACDGCGETMVAEMEAAYVPPPGWAIFDIAEDALRGGMGAGLVMTSVQDGKHLCAACTRAADALQP